MNMHFSKYPVLLLSLFLVLFSSVSFAQQNDGISTGGGFQLEFGALSDGIYFQDALANTLGNQLITADATIDPSQYILGPTDLITVTIEASQNMVFRALLINPQGDVIVPGIGSIHLDGATIEEAQQIINEEAEKHLRSPQAHISLERPRPLNVHVSGNVENPGKHTIPPFSRVDAALYSALFNVNTNRNNISQVPGNTVELLNAGPVSLRNIRIERQDGTTLTADLIAYFKAGTTESNPMVQFGDRIRVQKLSAESPRVSISGGVAEANEFEYTPHDTPELLIDIAGGFTPDADTSKVFVFRNTEGSQQKLEVDRAEWDTFDIQPNDRIIVPKNQQVNSSASAWVHGEVHTPGNFPIKNGQTTALELLTLAGDLTERALPSAAYLIRAGALENEIPNKFNTELMKRTSNQLAQGFEYLDLETNISKNKVFVDLKDEQQLSGVQIYDGDRLYVPRDEKTIFVFGQVNNPGYYPFTNSHRSVSDYISRAGGFALSANKERVFIIKAGSGTWFNPGETKLQSGDRIFVDRIPYDELNAKRTYEVQKEQIKNTRIQLIMTGISTITGIITTYVAIQNIRN